MASVREIKADLETQLKAKGADTPTFKAMLDDYMFFYQQMKKAQADVRKNGLMVDAVSAAGKKYKKQNDCAKRAVLYNPVSYTHLDVYKRQLYHQGTARSKKVDFFGRIKESR